MVSIIISFYERLRHLKCCLDSLSFCRSDFDEVIISDDGSGETTVNALKDVISNYSFPVRHIWRPKNGFRLSAIRNDGIRQARGDYLVFLDCDFILLKNTVKAHLDAAKPRRFVAGGCKYVSQSQTEEIFDSPLSLDRLEDLYKRLPEKDIIRAHRKFIRRTIMFRLRLENPRKQSLGGHFSIYRKDIETVNGYDENFVGWGGEDEDLGIRLVKAGIYCRSAIRRAKMLHLWHPSELGEKTWREGPNIEYFLRDRIPYFCENGLVKTGRYTEHG